MDFPGPDRVPRTPSSPSRTVAPPHRPHKLSPCEASVGWTPIRRPAETIRTFFHSQDRIPLPGPRSRLRNRMQHSTNTGLTVSRIVPPCRPPPPPSWAGGARQRRLPCRTRPAPFRTDPERAVIHKARRYGDRQRGDVDRQSVPPTPRRCTGLREKKHEAAPLPPRPSPRALRRRSVNTVHRSRSRPGGSGVLASGAATRARTGRVGCRFPPRPPSASAPGGAGGGPRTVHPEPEAPAP